MPPSPVIPLDYAVPDGLIVVDRPDLVCEVRGDGLVVHVRPVGFRRAGLPFVAALLAAALLTAPAITLLCLRAGAAPLANLALAIALLTAAATGLLAMLWRRCDLALRRFEFRADPRQLRLLSTGPAGRWTQRWPRDDIHALHLHPFTPWTPGHIVLTTRAGAHFTLPPTARPQDLAHLTQWLNKTLRINPSLKRDK